MSMVGGTESLIQLLRSLNLLDVVFPEQALAGTENPSGGGERGRAT